jgi:ACS family hexuronate transporter-like MFS transporter
MSKFTKINADIGRYRWTICLLIFFATTINYLDRQVLSYLAPDLSKEFGWTNSDYGNITAAFTFFYAISMLFAGRVIDKLGTKIGYIIAIVIWSLGAIMHAYSIQVGESFNSLIAIAGIAAVPVSIAGFIISRAVLALGEAGNFPAAIRATAEYFPKKERSFATGIFNSGATVGAILAPLTVPWIASHWGWQSAFIIVGAIGFLWIGFWHVFYEPPHKQKRLSKAEFDYINSDVDEQDIVTSDAASEPKTSWFQLLGYRQTWAFAFGKFMTDGVWWFFLFWLPTYLSAQYGMSVSGTALPLMVLYGMTMIGSVTGGWFPTYFVNRGYSPFVARRRAMFFIALFPLVVLLAQPLGYISYWVPVLLIGIGASAHQAWSCNIFTTVSDMFPKKSVASIVGIGGFAGGMGGVVLTKLGGWLFDHYGALGDIYTGYSIMFGICALAYLLALGVMTLLVPKHKPITDL